MLPRTIATITPINQPMHGAVTVPGSKSITNRALLTAALSCGTSKLSGALFSDDTIYMMKALNEFGVTVQRTGETNIEVVATGKLHSPSKPLMLGNAGTAMRFLTAAAALADGSVVLDGDKHMQKRPIAQLIASLNTLGIDARCETGCPPCVIKGVGTFPGGKIEVNGTLSSQYISALMMIAPMATCPTTIKIMGGEIGARGYLDITTSVMKAFGASINWQDRDIITISNKPYSACNYHIEPDASAATYFWAAEKLSNGNIAIGTSPAELSQPDAAAYPIIQKFPQMPAEINGDQMQDAIPTLAVLAAFNNSPVRFTGISNLRVKECDRIYAINEGLNRINPGLSSVDGDALLIHGNPGLIGQTHPCQINSFSDHRIAMSFALAGLQVGGIQILDPECVAKTFPEYWTELEKLGAKINFSTTVRRP
ncbi:3-phosphoshikimate 1-carboxyvinyltransferase [Thalassospira sp.]|uniref:3-phosphoshikimate 1-carboxyvinyltransferase n=1 Tax=Thalassospira sp. TaxID=1912094 RepID=UPI002733A5F6|nr:3-phosphoshikimate 1-carboxyvinyltransferase [Thalassospira sp.]MDP2699761.1 3-phosphoshikimate 1-carboxyvinyltransferase [Thalassospira sp.]